MTQKEMEQRALRVSMAANVIFTIAGAVVFAATGIQALFLDCFFSFIAFLSSVAAFFISKYSKIKTRHYPNGLHFLEPLYAILQSILTLVLLIFSVCVTARSAWDHFAHGIGEPMKSGPVVPYMLLMVALCFSLGIFNHRQNKKINGTSTILSSQSRTNFIDGLQSLGIGVFVIVLNLIPIDGKLGFLHYTGDFFITTALVVFSLKEPVKILLMAFRELSGATVDDAKLEGVICDSAQACLPVELPLVRCKIQKTGMYLSVFLYLAGNMDLEKLRQIKEKIRKTYENTEITFCQAA